MPADGKSPRHHRPSEDGQPQDARRSPRWVRVLLVHHGRTAPGLFGQEHRLGEEENGSPAAQNDVFARTMEEMGPRGVAVLFEPVEGDEKALQRLRERPFDLLLIQHAPPEHDAREFLRALRGGGQEEPAVVVSDPADDAFLRECFLLGAEVWARGDAGSPLEVARFLWQAIECCELEQENHRLRQRWHQFLRNQQAEAEQHLHSQRQLLEALRAPSPELDENGGGGIRSLTLSAGTQTTLESVSESYRQLLRMYVMMGAGHLSKDVVRWSDALAEAGIPASDLLRLHLQSVQELMVGLGRRGARHVLRRADLLLIEVLVHLNGRPEAVSAR